jgi:hypothetical protein
VTETAVAPRRRSGSRRSLPDVLDVREREAEAIRRRDTKMRRLLTRKGARAEREFLDGAGGKHRIKSVPVPGGSYVYDDSRSWGLRALGECSGADEKGGVKALAREYANRCQLEKRAVCRRLDVDDLKRNACPELAAQEGERG